MMLYRVFPRASTEAGCLSSVNVSVGGPISAQDRVVTDGKRTAVVLERNGWYSQDLVNALAAVILQVLSSSALTYFLLQT